MDTMREGEIGRRGGGGGGEAEFRAIGEGRGGTFNYKRPELPQCCLIAISVSISIHI